ncbi:MAG TPA: 3-hydroxyacyl-CoA dehydrogenase NAD-binding domain-containing protein [Tepidisphaeraceae bacterium]|nr:3-hydroxyacyl-CoA dehydrogenase NAD-binding domain-containing protein [Tepidisphaeraceae bacterium]
MNNIELQTIKTTVDPDGIMTVWIDVPGKSVNTIGQQMLNDLTAAVAHIEAERPKGVIFASKKNENFVAGGDLFEIRALKPDTMTKFLSDGQGLYDRIARLPMPTVVAMNGDCLGGGMELALACTYRVAAEDGSINIGLPETKIGILPGWGGTVRLPKLIGITRALPLILQGKALPPRKAKKIGMIDEVVRPEAILAAAKRLILTKPKIKRKLAFIDKAAKLGLIRKKVLATAEKKTLATTHGNYPAAMKVIDIVRTTFNLGHEAGLAAERQSLRELMDTPACENLMRLFFLRQRVKRALADQIHAKPREVKFAAVIGGGTMGAGIAHGLARAGIQVRLIEVNANAAAAALGRIKKTLEEEVGSGKINILESRHIFNRISPTVEWTGLNNCDLVVEAVAESMDVKRDVFARLDKLCPPDAVLASNTSSLSVTEMAQATTKPNRVVGLHFFNPVPKMPLVEVVRTDLSDDVSLATAASVAAKMGKTAVLVKDAPGFLVNRVLIPYLVEALVLAEEGASINHIDKVMKKWGMPMGPFELLDEIGLDIGAHVLKSVGDRMDPPLRVPPAIGTALSKKWLGKKSCQGFYIHSKKKGVQPKLNDELAAMLVTRKGVTHTDEEIERRLLLPMVNEAVRLLSEGVTDSADTIDLATVFGLGFAPFRGGLAHFGDSLGADKIVAQLDELAAKHGPRFAPAAPLKWLAENHRPIADTTKFEPSHPPVRPAETSVRESQESVVCSPRI